MKRKTLLGIIGAGVLAVGAVSYKFYSDRNYNIQEIENTQEQKDTRSIFQRIKDYTESRVAPSLRL